MKLERAAIFLAWYSVIGFILGGLAFVAVNQILNFWATLLVVTVLLLIYDFLVSVVIVRRAFRFTKLNG